MSPNLFLYPVQALLFISPLSIALQLCYKYVTEYILQYFISPVNAFDIKS